MTAQGIDVSGRVIVLHDLETELESGGVAVPNGLTIAGPPSASPVFPPPPPDGLPAAAPAGAKLFTYDDQWQLADLPAEALSIVEGYSA